MAHLTVRSGGRVKGDDVHDHHHERGEARKGVNLAKRQIQSKAN